jgi:pyruvate,water dikinase
MKKERPMTSTVRAGRAVCWLGDLADGELTLAGGKASTLARLHRAGYPVPDGFVILPAAFMGDELRPETWIQVQVHLQRMRADQEEGRNHSFAIRSSAAGEDSAGASFAGAFETVLGVDTDEAIHDAIHTVRRSRHADRVRAYREAREAAGSVPDRLAPSEMAVLVQRLIPAEFSGVLFTADPVTGGREEMTGNYARGLGAPLVSGLAQPSTFRLSRRYGFIPGWVRGRYEGSPELKRYAGRLFQLGLRLEREAAASGSPRPSLVSPQDIEWAVAGGELALLQSRPITTLHGFDPATGAFNDSLTGDYVWSCVNIGEAMSVVMTPYTWSLVGMAFDELSAVPGYAPVGNIGGRAYQNVTVMTSMMRVLRRGSGDLLRELGGVREEYLETMDQYIVPLPEATLWTVLPGALRVLLRQRVALKDLEEFLGENPAWCDTARERIRAMATREGLARLAGELTERCLATFWRTIATAWAYAERSGKLRRELKELVGAADADLLLSNVSGQGQLLASLGPMVGLARVYRGEMSRQDYLAQWGHRGPLETEASIPRPAEDPQWLDGQLAEYENALADPEALLARRQAEAEAAWERLQKRHPRRVKRLRRRLALAADAARSREAVRSEFTRLVWVARTWALRVGELTRTGNGAFFLTLGELLELLAGQDGPVATIPARQRTYERYRALPPYPLIIRGRFDPFEWATDPDRRSDVYDAGGLLQQIRLAARRENLVLGMAGSAGHAEGAVRRLEGPQQGGELRPGEILVTSQTNIGWTLFFPRAAAVVTDVGAPLSHAAIVARELGIPAVVNCGDATARLRTGDRVHVDGGQGVVEILAQG